MLEHKIVTKSIASISHLSSATRRPPQSDSWSTGSTFRIQNIGGSPNPLCSAAGAAPTFGLQPLTTSVKSSERNGTSAQTGIAPSAPHYTGPAIPASSALSLPLSLPILPTHSPIPIMLLVHADFHTPHSTAAANTALALCPIPAPPIAQKTTRCHPLLLTKRLPVCKQFLLHISTPTMTVHATFAIQSEQTQQRVDRLSISRYDCSCCADTTRADPHLCSDAFPKMPCKLWRVFP